MLSKSELLSPDGSFDCQIASHDAQKLKLHESFCTSVMESCFGHAMQMGVFDHKPDLVLADFALPTRLS